MDLSTIDTTSAANEGAKMEVRDPNGAPVLKDDGGPVTITLLGKDSDVFVRHANGATNRRLAQGTRMKLTAEALKADGIAALAKCTVAWDGVVVDSEAWPCTYENAVRLYTRFAFIREQADEFIDDRALFMKASPKS